MTGTETPTDLVVFPNGANIFPNIHENIRQLTQDNNDGRYDDLIDFLRDLTDEDYLTTPRGLVFTAMSTMANDAMSAQSAQTLCTVKSSQMTGSPEKSAPQQAQAGTVLSHPWRSTTPHAP